MRPGPQAGPDGTQAIAAEFPMKCTLVDNMAGKHELVTDLHTESILNMLGDARSHFTIVPVSANTIKVRNYRHRKRLAQLAAARAADTAANSEDGSRRRSALESHAVDGNGASGAGSMNPQPNPR